MLLGTLFHDIRTRSQAKKLKQNKFKTDKRKQYILNMKAFAVTFREDLK